MVIIAVLLAELAKVRPQTLMQNIDLIKKAEYYKT